MAPSSGQISFTYGGTEVAISAPEFGYSTNIKFPFDYTQLDDSSYASRDEGAQYDKRVCECSIYLTVDEQAALNTLIHTTARGQDVILTLPSGSGFFPFGPDKGDTGVFTVAITLNGTPAIQMAPFQYFKCSLQIINVGDFPSYSLPSEISEGSFVLGDVVGCRMPQNLFEPLQRYSISIGITESNRSEYWDRGSGGDNKRTGFVMQANESKAAAIAYYLSATVRNGEFSVFTPDNFFMFGSDGGSSSTYTCIIINSTITIKHTRHNEYEFSLELYEVV